MNHLSRSLRSLIKGLGQACQQHKVIIDEDRLNHVGRTRRPLTEPAMTNGYTTRLRESCIANAATKTPTFVLRHPLSSPLSWCTLGAKQYEQACFCAHLASNRYTDALPIPRRLAISVAPKPSFARLRTFARLMDGFLPL